MADVEDVNLLLFFQHAVDHAIDARLVTEQQMAEIRALGSNGAAIGALFQTEDLLFESLIPAESGGRFGGVNMVEDQSQIPPRPRHKLNEIGHTFS
jgi:hypothetical protein